MKSLACVALFVDSTSALREEEGRALGVSDIYKTNTCNWIEEIWRGGANPGEHANSLSLSLSLARTPTHTLTLF